MNAHDRKYFGELLEEERRRIVAELDSLGEGMNRTPRESAGDLSAYGVHMADQASDNMEREKNFYVADMEGQQLAEVESAIERVHSGAYGLCAGCGREIPRERLEAVPHARLCIDCQEKQERDGGPHR